MRFLPLALFLALAAVAQQSPVPALGSPASALALSTASGAPLRLDTLADTRPVLLVLLEDSTPQALCESIRSLANLASPNPIHRVAVLANGSAAANCGVTPAVTSATLTAASLSHPAGAVPATALIIDDSLHVRLRVSLHTDHSSWDTLQAKLAQWFQGRQTYEANCGHCHGFDGAQSSAPETKSLVGITRKYPDAKVLALGAQFGGVDMTGWSDSKKETLLTYLRGL